MADTQTSSNRCSVAVSWWLAVRRVAMPLLAGLVFASGLQNLAVARTCRDSVPLTTPTRDFALLDGGQALHRPSGLIWTHCALGQNGPHCFGEGTLMTWQDALLAASVAEYAGQSGWRLPSITELDTI